MTLSNYLTRDEWNAAFFGYFFLVKYEKAIWPVDLSTQLRTGILLLNSQNYTNWQGVSVGEQNSNINSVQKTGRLSLCTRGKDNSNCLVEILNGTLDYKERAFETLEWLTNNSKLFDVEFIEKFELMLAEVINAFEQVENETK